MNEITPLFGAIITANNYLHDVATALMLVSFGGIWYVSRCFDQNSSPETSRLYLSLYRKMYSLTKFSFIWILLGGIPRTIYYTRLEWASAVGDTQVVIIVIKHVIVLAFLGAGGYYWLRFKKQAGQIEKELLK